MLAVSAIRTCRYGKSVARAGEDETLLEPGGDGPSSRQR
jgi:hypothetical protein